MNNFWYKFLKVLLTPIYKFYYNPKVFNKEYLNVEGPLIIAGNHIHLMDQCNVIISSKRVITYMAKKEYFDSFKTRWFFKLVGCIPVDRGNKEDTSKVKAIQVLNKGGCIGIFPEGTRNKTKEKLLSFKYGAVSMAQKTNATIVPFGVSGKYKFRSKDLKICFGKPFKVENMSIEDANTYLYNEVSRLIDETKNQSRKLTKSC